MAAIEDGYVIGLGGRFYEVCTDQLGQRLWINSDDGSAVARFNTRAGVDLHTTLSAQMEGVSECLWCAHEQPDYRTWQTFIVRVKEHFGITLSIDAIDVGLLRL